MSNQQSNNDVESGLDWVNLLLENYNSSNTPLPSFGGDSNSSSYSGDAYSYQFVTTKSDRSETYEYNQNNCQIAYENNSNSIFSASGYNQDGGDKSDSGHIGGTTPVTNNNMWIDSDSEDDEKQHQKQYKYTPSFTDAIIVKTNKIKTKGDNSNLLSTTSSSSVSLPSSSSSSASSITSYWTTNNPTSLITYASLLPFKSAILHTFQLSLKRSSKMFNQTILNLQLYIDSNPKLLQAKEAILDTSGCVSESVLYMSDRMSCVTEEYIRLTITADDPDTQHMKQLISDVSWETLPLRCSLASLTWSQLQLVDTATASYSSGTTTTSLSSNSNSNSYTRLLNNSSNNTAVTATAAITNADINKEWLYHQRACHRQHSQAMYKYLLSLKSSTSTLSTSPVTATTAGLQSLSYQSSSIANIHITNYDITSPISDTNTNDDTESDNDWIDKQSTSPPTSSFFSSSSSSLSSTTISEDDQWWLATRAQQGDVEAQYALSKWFAPPAFEEIQYCRVCQRVFGARLFRHHCRMCGHSLCGTHSSHKRVILHLGYTNPVRCCHECSVRLDAEAHYNQLHWRELRVQGYLRNALVPYSSAVSVVDTRARKALRVVDASITVAKRAASFNYPAYLVLQTVDILRRYGMSGLAGVLMRQDFFYAVETLKRITGVDLVFRMSLHELTACIYYKLAVDRGLRGCDHEGEKRMHEEEDEAEEEKEEANEQYRHNDFPANNNNNHDNAHQYHYYGQHQQSSSSQLNQRQSFKPNHHRNNLRSRLRKGTELTHELTEAIRLVPLALQAVYEPSPVECQRVAASQGWLTVLCCSDSAAEQPAYALFASVPPLSTSTATAAANSNSNNNSKNGSNRSSISNNINSKNNNPSSSSSSLPPPPLSHKKEAVLAVRGTYSIHDLVTDIRAAPHRFPPSASDVADAIHGVFRHKDPESSYGAAQRVDAPCSAGATTCGGSGSGTATMRNTDVDTKPINSCNSTNNNTAATTTEDEGFVPVSVSQWEWTMDMQDTQYACRGMAVSALWLLTQIAPSLLTLAAEGYEIILTGHSLGAGVAVLLTEMLKESILNIRAVVFGCPCCVDAVTADAMKQRVISIILHDDFISRVTPKTIRLLMKDLYAFRSQVFTHLSEDWRDVTARAATLWSPRWRESTTQTQTQSPTKQNNINTTKGIHGNNQIDMSKNNKVGRNKHTIPTNNNSQDCSSDERYDIHNDNNNISAAVSNDDDPKDSTTTATDIQSDWFLSEDVIADLWLPGTLLHVYSHHGQYHIAEVDRSFASLRRIEVQGNMFADHSSRDIFDALLEARAVLAAPHSPPVWTSYDAVDRCECCLNAFTWHSTFRGQAQEYRERHNCRNCGQLVCDPCSSHTRPIPRLGLIFPARICDTCFFRGDYATS